MVTTLRKAGVCADAGHGKAEPWKHKVALGRDVLGPLMSLKSASVPRFALRQHSCLNRIHSELGLALLWTTN